MAIAQLRHLDKVSSHGKSSSKESKEGKSHISRKSKETVTPQSDESGSDEDEEEITYQGKERSRADGHTRNSSRRSPDSVSTSSSEHVRQPHRTAPPPPESPPDPRPPQTQYTSSRADHRTSRPLAPSAGEFSHSSSTNTREGRRESPVGKTGGSHSFRKKIEGLSAMTRSLMTSDSDSDWFNQTSRTWSCRSCIYITISPVELSTSQSVVVRYLVADYSTPMAPCLIFVQVSVSGGKQCQAYHQCYHYQLSFQCYLTTSTTV